MVALSLTAAQPAAAAVTVIRHTLPVADQGVEPAYIVEGSDGNLWYTYSFQADVGRITPSGTVTDFPIPTVNAVSGGIAAGSDGALWFCEFQGQKIGRITTSGSVTEYTLPPGTNPQFITAGPDGALWFTEEGARDIGRITTSGSISEFPIPGSGRGAEDIVTGSDHNLWFTDPANARVGRLTPAGALTYFTVPDFGTRTATPGFITAGPDGNLWVSDDQGTIDRITTAGAVTEFPNPSTAGGVPITAGPDGNLWVSGQAPAILQRVTTSGVITNEATLSGQGGGITRGPGNSLWFTILNPGEVDSVNLAPPTPPPTQGFNTADTNGGVNSFGTDTFTAHFPVLESIRPSRSSGSPRPRAATA